MNDPHPKGRTPGLSKTVNNALEILMAFGHTAECRVSDLARELDLPMSVTHRLVRTLTEAAFLEQPSERGPYVLGPALAALAQTADRRRTLASVSHRQLVELAERVDDAVDLNVLREDRYICIDGVDLSNRAHSIIEVGDSLGLHAGAAGKVILAFQSETFIQRIASAPLLKLTESTLSNREELITELGRVRESGYAYSESEVTPGTCSLAAPIRNGAGEVVASLNVFTTSDRMSSERITDVLAHLLPAAHQLSKSLGHTWLDTVSPAQTKEQA